MNQQSTHGWIIGGVLSFFLWSFIGFVVLLLRFPMSPTFLVIFWLSGIMGLIIILTLQNKYPSLRSGVKSFVLGMVIFFFLDSAMYGFVAPQLYSLNNPSFRILDTSDTFDSTSGNYVFHVKIRNDGTDGYVTVSCEVQKADLTTKTKSQTIYLQHNQETILHFYFSIFEDLGGQLVEKYRFSFES